MKPQDLIKFRARQDLDLPKNKLHVLIPIGSSYILQ